MKILLLRNYRFDGSVSMRVFADALQRELTNAGVNIRGITPKAVLGLIHPGASGVGKWLGYIDRFVFFPAMLMRAAATADVIHICDHGSAMYTSFVGRTPVIVTCHDMLAVRGAMGEIEDLRPSFFGRFLQNWIVTGLRQATRLACVSQFTFEDVARVLGSTENVCKVLNGLPHAFGVIEPDEANRRLAIVPELRKPYVLHVGSDHRRKNREAVLRVFAKSRAHVNVQLVLAGEAPSQRVLGLVDELGIRDSVIYMTRPETEVIEALYNCAMALLFPSRNEGFGWPPIEAQACGCPVVASAIPPLEEVLGDSAELFAVEDEDGMSAGVVRLATDEAHREQMRERGFKNVRERFQTSRMIEEYLNLYRELSREELSRPETAGA